MRILLAQQFMTDVDGLHGKFLTIDENGQRLFAITSADGSPQNAAMTIMELASAPLGIGSVTPATVAATGGATLTIRGSGFAAGSKVTVGGNPAATSFKDVNTLSVTAPAMTAGPQRIAIANTEGQTVVVDALLTAN